MRRSYVAGLIAAVSLLATAACSLVTSLDGLSTTVVVIEAEAGDGGAGDASSDVTLTDAPADGAGPIVDAGDAAGPPNIHPQGTFEGNDGCSPWTAFQGASSKSAIARSGTGSCRICTTPVTTDYFTGDDNGASGPSVVGASYRAEGWARTDPVAGVPLDVTMILRNVAYEPFVTLDTRDSASSTIGATWTRFEATLATTKAGTLNVVIGAGHAAGACFLIDDVIVQRVK